MSIAFLIPLRFVHVISSFCWAGGAFVNYLFVEPTARDLAPDGPKFVQHMVTKRKFSIFMAINSTLTVASGALLLWQLTRGQFSAYIQTGPGLGFAIGSMVGIAVYLVGMFGIKPRAEQMAEDRRESPGGRRASLSRTGSPASETGQGNVLLQPDRFLAGAAVPDPDGDLPLLPVLRRKIRSSQAFNQAWLIERGENMNANPFHWKETPQLSLVQFFLAFLIPSGIGLIGFHVLLEP